MNCQEHRPILHDGELVCGRCGVIVGAYDDSAINGAEITASGHASVDYLKLVKMGSSHDYVSPTNKGLAFQLNDPRGKDFEKRKTVAQLSDPYTTGQIVEKGSIAYTDEEGKTRAYKPITDDTTFRKAKQKAHQLAVKYDLDMVAQMYYERILIKKYHDNVGFSDWMPLAGLIELVAEFPGLNLDIADQVMADFDKICGKMRDTLMKTRQKATLKVIA